MTEENNKKNTIIVEGTKYITQFTKKFLQRKRWKKPNPNCIISIIPGSILEINVKEGDKLKKGTQLMVIEAMKMKNIIEMPFDGEIMKISVSVGQAVPKDFLMMEIKQ